MSGLLNEIKSKASKLNRKIVLPESHDERVLKAASILKGEGIACPVLIGNQAKVYDDAAKSGIELKGIEIIDHLTDPLAGQFSAEFFELRKNKGMTPEKAAENMKRDLFFGAMMLRNGLVDGMVAGSFASTGDVLRSGLQCVGLAEGIATVSSFFLMIFPERNLCFADCAVVPDPTPEQLADIAESTSDNYYRLTGIKPKTAMLSFSTKGSAVHPLADKVINALGILKNKRPDIESDGEMQFDAAVVESIGQRKAPGSSVAGKANVLVFPDLNAGNIGYKIAERLGGAEAVGPIIQGLRKPLFDLSRGCSVNDIVNTSAICALMA